MTTMRGCTSRPPASTDFPTKSLYSHMCKNVNYSNLIFINNITLCKEMLRVTQCACFGLSVIMVHVYFNIYDTDKKEKNTYVRNI